MDEPPISRGFRSRRREESLTNRIPPGQYVTTDFPVLSAGPTPQVALDEWTFELRFDGWVLGKWIWAEFQALPQTTIKTDIHCVTKWSKLDTVWQGVSFDDLLKAVNLKEAPAPYVMAHSDGGYTTNVPVADLVGGKGMIATRYDGRQFRRRTEVRLGCLSHISTFGRAPNGRGDCGSWKGMNVASGSCSAITTTATPGKSNDMTAIERPAGPVRRLRVAASSRA